MELTHLQRLEAESIFVLREVVAETDKAFYPASPPFPQLHVDNKWKFRDMYEMRNRMARGSCM